MGSNPTRGAILGKIFDLLEKNYGPRHWKPHDAISVLVQTILSQNTSDINSKRAFHNLISTFKAWEEVANAPIEKIAEPIKCSGLGRVKAQRIKQALKEILQKRGALKLSFLKELPLSQAKAWLRRLPGVGAKTAGCVLLFSLGRPALPVDTHVFRVAKRLGLINPHVSIERAHDLLEAQIPPEKVYQFHLHLIEHGRKICRARNPLCLDCFLKTLCPSAH